MSLDPTVNFGKVTVSTGYDSSAYTIALQSGHGAKLPDPLAYGSFNLVWWNFTDYPDPSDDPNVEIVRCIIRSTDTLTLIRAQEGISASTKNTIGKTYKMILSLTKKMITDINTEIDTHIAASVAHGVTGAIVGSTDTQTLTNKTITDTGSYVMARYLKSLTTSVDVSASAAPTVGQVLTATSGTAATWQTIVSGVSSVFGRTGSVTAQSNDYTWAQINKTTSNIADITTKSHTSLTDIGTNSHATIDTAILNSTTHIAASVAHGVSSSIVGSTDTQTLTNKTITDTGSYVMARYLKSLTTSVDVSASAAPTVGQVLTATSGTAATWQTPIGSGLGAGVILPYGGASAPPGWLLCNGSAVSRTTYAVLFAVIGTAYGIGDGSTTFNLPDMRGRVPVCIGGSGVSNRGDTGGEQTHTLITNEMPVHSHPTWQQTWIAPGSSGAYGMWAQTGSIPNTGNAGGGATHQNMQPYVGVQYIIKSG